MKRYKPFQHALFVVKNHEMLQYYTKFTQFRVQDFKTARTGEETVHSSEHAQAEKLLRYHVNSSFEH